MAHFAQLDENNFVLQVIVIKNEEILDDNGQESEAKGIAFCQSLFGADTRWLQTSYNSNFRKNYAVVGGEYSPDIDAFVYPKPVAFPSFVLDPNTAQWIPPIPLPTDTVYVWNENSVSWIQVPQPFPSWTAQGNPLWWTPPVPRPQENPNDYVWDENTLSWVFVPNPHFVQAPSGPDAP